MLDEPFSGRNYPLKSLMKDNSTKNENTPNTKPTEKATNFSYFVKQNALVNYYDNSPVRKRDLPSHNLKEKNQLMNDQDNDEEQDKVRIQTVDFEDNDDGLSEQVNMQFSNFQVFAEKDTNVNNKSNEILSSSLKQKKSIRTEDSNSINNVTSMQNSCSKKGSNMFLNMNVNMNVVAPGYIDYGNISSMKSMSTSDEPQNILPSFTNRNNNLNRIKNNNKKEQIANRQNQYSNQKNNSQQGNINCYSAGMNANQNMNFNANAIYHNQFHNQMSQINYHQPFDILVNNLSNKQMNPPWNQNNMNMNIINPHIQNKDFFMNPYMNQQDYYFQQQAFPLNSFMNPYIQQQQQQNQFQLKQQQAYNSQIFPKKKAKALMQNLSNLSPSELIKNSTTICKDQSGCRFLQKKIDENPNLVQPIIQSLFENAIEIITDPFGNYLFQKLFDFMLHEQFCQLMALIQIYISQICCNSHGTRVIQKLINYINTEVLIRTFTNLIKPVLKDIILNINGSHIVIKVIDLCNPIATKVFYDEICSNIIPIATHKHGCCVLQKCIEKAPLKINQRIISLLIANCEELILDQCGNYIMQYIITFQIEYIHEKVTDHLIKDILTFSKQKYSSNVVEKCFECCSDKICQKLLIALRDSHICIKLLFDKFGNYVIQKALQRADDDAQHFILNSISPCIYKLKNYPFGMKLYNKLIITYPYLSQKMLKIDQNNSVDNFKQNSNGSDWNDREKNSDNDYDSGNNNNDDNINNYYYKNNVNDIGQNYQ